MGKCEMRTSTMQRAPRAPCHVDDGEIPDLIWLTKLNNDGVGNSLSRKGEERRVESVGRVSR